MAGGGNAQPADLAKFVWAGGHLLATGLDLREVESLGLKVAVKQEEYLGGLFNLPGYASPFAGIGAADVHLHGPRELPLISDGVLAAPDPWGVLSDCTVAV